MSILRIKTDGSETWFKPGSTVSGDASWHLDTDAETLEVRLFWYTEGRGTQDVEVVDTLRLHQPAASDHRRFSFQIPEGPYSFSGRLITLRWAIELVALPGEEAERVDLVVAPQPVEISIQELRES